jgi:hypothetical protein
MQGLYTKILNYKFVPVCILFTVITLLDTILIPLGLWPSKIGEEPYIHLLGRFILLSLLVSGLYIFDTLRKDSVKAPCCYWIACGSSACRGESPQLSLPVVREDLPAFFSAGVSALALVSTLVHSLFNQQAFCIGKSKRSGNMPV